MAIKNLKTYLAVFSVTAFVVISLFGLSHTAGMRANDDGNMEGCIFTGKTMLCGMDVIEHVSLWQGMFTATHRETVALAILLVLCAVAIFIVINYSPPFRDATIAIRIRLYFQQHRDISLYNPLRRAFARGIIHPKIYEFANL